MSILDRAKSHFESKGIKEITVPEWGDGDEPAVLFCEPITLNDQKSLRKLADGDDFEFAVRLVIMKLVDSNGKKVFDLSDKPTLMNKVDPNVLLRVANMIAYVPSIEDSKGN